MFSIKDNEGNVVSRSSSIGGTDMMFVFHCLFGLEEKDLKVVDESTGKEMSYKEFLSLENF